MKQIIKLMDAKTDYEQILYENFVTIMQNQNFEELKENLKALKQDFTK